MGSNYCGRRMPVLARKTNNLEKLADGCARGSGSRRGLCGVCPEWECIQIPTGHTV